MEKRRISFVRYLFKLADFVEIEARRKVPLAAGEYHHVDVLALTQSGEYRCDFLKHIGRESVALVMAVDGDSGDLLDDIEKKIAILHVKLR